MDKNEEVRLPVTGDDPLLGGFRITKIVCTRSLRTPYGDIFQGLTASRAEGDGSDIKKARVAALRLGLEVERLAHQRAVLAHIIEPEASSSTVNMIIEDYLVAIRMELDPRAAAPAKADGG